MASPHGVRVVRRPAARPSITSGSPAVLAETGAFCLPVNAYLDCRVPEFAWFEHFGLIKAEGAEVVIQPGALDMILTLAGLHPVSPENVRG